MNPMRTMGQSIELGVNIDHVATLRNARGTEYPDPLQAALLAESAGADAITLHLREDRRHIRDADVIAIRPRLLTRMNLEAAVTEEMLEFACRIQPQDVCLVPERREEVTTEGGLDIVAGFERVRQACERLKGEGIRVSLFIDAAREQIDAACAAGAPVIEIHTGSYANSPAGAARAAELARVSDGARYANSLGLKVNAGHGLNLQNVEAIAVIAEIGELNIGHALVADALFVGWENAIRQMKALMVAARASQSGSGSPS